MQPANAKTPDASAQDAAPDGGMQNLRHEIPSTAYRAAAFGISTGSFGALLLLEGMTRADVTMTAWGAGFAGVAVVWMLWFETARIEVGPGGIGLRAFGLHRLIPPAALGRKKGLTDVKGRAAGVTIELQRPQRLVGIFLQDGVVVHVGSAFGVRNSLLCAQAAFMLGVTHDNPWAGAAARPRERALRQGRGFTAFGPHQGYILKPNQLLVAASWSLLAGALGMTLAAASRDLPLLGGLGLLGALLAGAALVWAKRAFVASTPDGMLRAGCGKARPFSPPANAPLRPPVHPRLWSKKGLKEMAEVAGRASPVSPGKRATDPGRA